MKICNFEVSNKSPLILIGGLCVLENEEIAFLVAKELKNITSRLGINFIFKASFDKANRSSVNGARGVGLEAGLEIFKKLKKDLQINIITDVHEYTPIEKVAKVVDVLQTPAFLCRQTDFMQNVARANLPINVKKGQFIAPEDMKNVVEKMTAVGNNQIMLCERGFSFGYHNLVVDMRSLEIMKRTNYPVIFDATHSVQLPGGLGNATGGNREFIEPLARAATAIGIAGIFIETHPNPEKALSDGPNSLYLDHVYDFLAKLQKIDNLVKTF